MTESKYLIKRTKRCFDQTSDDYHATVTRLSDGKQLIFISNFKRLLTWRLRPKALDRAYRRVDKYERKVKKEEVEYFE